MVWLSLANIALSLFVAIVCVLFLGRKRGGDPVMPSTVIESPPASNLPQEPQPDRREVKAPTVESQSIDANELAKLRAENNVLHGQIDSLNGVIATQANELADARERLAFDENGGELRLQLIDREIAKWQGTGREVVPSIEFCNMLKRERSILELRNG